MRFEGYTKLLADLLSRRLNSFQKEIKLGISDVAITDLVPCYFLFTREY
ncbi:hypothetical protein Pla110_02820 [Polystyrenella longa]|uniref:Uncharacterized protein n=1 Tax=Polystyrenella longa TaxID=2528007 RepID=A0A518CH76_9PLAN|nr:hypothetical protein Pla110_02820 [Polystyrenella longa]